MFSDLSPLMAPMAIALGVAALAASAAVDAWFGGAPLAGARARVARALARPAPPAWARLLACPYCLTHWAVAATLAALLVGPRTLPALVYALAAVRLATLLHDLLPDHAAPRAIAPDFDPAPEDDAAAGPAVARNGGGLLAAVAATAADDDDREAGF